MRYEMSVQFKGDHVEAISHGDKSLTTAKMLWAEITRLCIKHDCFHVLGIADSTKQMTVMDSMDHQKLFKDFNVTHRYKIAWVELNEEEFGKLKTLETIMVNRGFRGKAFKDVNEARSWLLGEQA